MRQTLSWGSLGCALASGLLAACAAVGTLQENDAGMGPGEAEPLDCARSPAETAAGQCVGTVLSYCVTGELNTVDCAVVGAVCGLEPATQVFACRQPMTEPQPGVPEPGTPPEPAPGAEPEPSPQPEPQAPAGLPCDADPDGTECDGDTIIICRDGEPSGRTDCAANGLSCGPVPSGGVGCVADGDPGGGPVPEPEAPMPPGGDGICGGRDGGARCDGDTVVQCRGGQEDSRFDCTSNGQTCQIFDNTWAGCEGENQNPNVPNPEPEPPGEPCTAENFFGRCVGNVLEGCNLIDMEVFRIDCTILGATCRQQDGLFGCW
ncbi:MAG: hypothetical protein ACI9U2_003936 [Bradymonadia bacterium]|jgi:hypothetical protein